MKIKRKTKFKLNLMSIVFAIISLMSVTLAWFAYSGMVKTQLDVNVKSWYIELEKDGQTVSNQVVMSLEDIYPGMDVHTETIKMKNLGDSDASVKYKIESVRIFDQETGTSNYTDNDFIRLEDSLSHDYPFHINISLSKNYILSKTDETLFNISVSWPLDSGHDEEDATWGNQAYSFKNSEANAKELDASYMIRPSIKIVINLTAEQYMENPDSQDLNYPLGKSILYDVVSNQKCTQVSSTCLSTNVIDVNNKRSDTKVTLLPNVESINDTTNYANYDTSFNNKVSSWTVETRKLQLDDILKIVSNDIIDSKIVTPNLSDEVIGTLKYNTRLAAQLIDFATSDKSYVFSNDYTYFLSNNCYWTTTEYDNNKMFSVVSNIDNTTIYGEDKTNSCKIVPVILANKSALE